jgi:hypothetical protein
VRATGGVRWRLDSVTRVWDLEIEGWRSVKKVRDGEMGMCFARDR